MGTDKVAAALADWRTAPVDEKVRVMLGFLDKMTRTPEALTPADAAGLRAAGLSEEAIDDAIVVCAAFNLIARLADTFEFQLQTPAELESGARSLLQRGYQI